MKKKLIYSGLLMVAFLSLWVGKDLYENAQITTYSAKPESKHEGNATRVLWALENSKEADF